MASCAELTVGDTMKGLWKTVSDRLKESEEVTASMLEATRTSVSK